MASGAMFETLGVGSSLGRVLGPADDEPGTQAVVLTHDYWRRRFAADPGVLGKTIRIQWRPYTIVGVAARGFNGMQPGMPCEVIVPLSHMAELFDGPDWNAARLLWIELHGRLAPGVSIEQARTELRTRWPAILEATAPTDAPSELVRRHFARVIEVESAERGFSRYQDAFQQPLAVLAGVVGALLLIVCVNLANLMLAQSLARQRETAIRLAVGAGRGRVFRQAALESVLLTAAGATLGVVFSSWFVRALVALWNAGPARLALDLRLDLRLFAFLCAATLVTALLAGLGPALSTAFGAAVSPLKETRSGGRNRTQGALLAAQIAFSMMLLVAAGLLSDSLRNLRSQPLDFQLDGVAQLSLSPAGGGYGEIDLDSYYGRLLAETRAIPGVESAALGDHYPTGVWPMPSAVAGPEGESAEGVTATGGCVSPEYFSTLVTPLVAGRAFSVTDRAGSPRVAVVNQTLARRLFPGRDPVGQPVGFGLEAQERDMTVVGVVRDSGYRGFRENESAALYTPCAQQAGYRRGGLTLFVRTTGPIGPVLAALRQRIESLGVEAPVRVATLREQANQTLSREHAIAWVASAFAVLAVALVAIGLYGLLSFLVRSRTREIGVRMALGANAGRVLWWVAGKALLLSVSGVLAGIPLALIAANYSQSLLFEVEPGGASAMLGSAAVLLAVAAAATVAPARRAAGLAPTDALRQD
jgi:predicted permease